MGFSRQFSKEDQCQGIAICSLCLKCPTQMYYKGSYISRNQILLHLMRWMFLYKHCDLQNPRLPSKKNKKTMKLSCKNDSSWTSASLWHQSWWHEYISAWFLICQQQTKPWTTSFVKWTFCEKLDYDCFWWRKINVMSVVVGWSWGCWPVICGGGSAPLQQRQREERIHGGGQTSRPRRKGRDAGGSVTLGIW